MKQGRWLAAALAVASLYGMLALRLAFRVPDLVADDARQHVFWMHRFRDPTLFPHDLIADYFQTVAPAGYKAIYWIFAKCGLDPLLFSKILPACIALAVAYFAFRVFMELLPSPRGAFFASVILSQLIWLKDDVMSATPRAFVYPLFLAFFLFLLRRRLLPCLVLLTLQALIYPQSALFSLALLGIRTLRWENRRPRFSRERADYIFLGAGGVVTAITLALFAHSLADYGPVISRHVAKGMREFSSSGRARFFSNGLHFWLFGSRSGFLPNHVPSPFVALASIACLAAILSRRIPRLRTDFRAAPLLQILLASLGMWLAAHAVLFHLHLPARYSHWVFRILIALTAALALEIFCRLMEKWRPHLLPAVAIVALLSYPHFALGNFPADSYNKSGLSGLHEFLRSQPKGTLVATVAENGAAIPAIAQRSIFVSADHAIPYHQGYYRQIRQRGRELFHAHYTANATELRDFIEQNEIDLFIVADVAFTPSHIRKLRWYRDIASTAEVAAAIESGERPALADFIESAKVWQDDDQTVLDARLIARSIR